MKTRRLVNGDTTFGQGMASYLVGGEAVSQNVATRLRVVLGEYFLDQSIGIPYMPNAGAPGAQTFNQFPGNVAYASACLKACILDTDGVATLDAFTASFDHTTRACTVEASGTTLFDDEPWSISFTLGA